MSSLQQLFTDAAGLQDLFGQRSAQLAQRTAAFLETHRALAQAEKDAISAEAAEQFRQGRLYAAEQLCRLVLQSFRQDLKALHLLATIATQLGHHENAVDLLLDCLDVDPGLSFIRHDLANAFFKSGNFPMALDQSTELLAHDPANVGYAALRAGALVKLGRYGEATAQYEKILESTPDDAEVLLRYGVALRIVGRTPEAIGVFRKVIARQPDCGEAYWNLANLKTFRFEARDIDGMRAALASDRLKPQNRVYLSFALGKALDDEAQFAEAFRQYAEANELARRLAPYDPATTSGLVRQCRQTFTREYFESRGPACEAPDPIFIVGLPRSGSTLLEQVLSNHSAIDATMELSEVSAMVRSLNNPHRTGRPFQYPGILKTLQPAELAALGEEYLKRTRCFRGDRPFFIDKAPHNFLHIGLIASILPKAKFIDARRHPLACGFSIYTQFFARGTAYAYDLEHIGLYYRDYLQLMGHWHEVLPGRILTVHYEDVVADLEAQARAIFEYCALAFEPQCLAFHESKRAVATVSSEQVRQPVYRSALEHWLHYERELQPLRQALGDALPADA